jgi:hypothetical protein
MAAAAGLICIKTWIKCAGDAAPESFIFAPNQGHVPDSVILGKRVVSKRECRDLSLASSRRCSATQ